MDDVTLLVKRKRPAPAGPFGLSPRDVPYVVIIVLCMAVAFMSGRMSAPDPVSRAAVPVPSVVLPSPSAPVVVPVQTAVISLRDLPEDIPPPPAEVSRLPEEVLSAAAPAQSVRAQQQRPAPPAPRAVPPEKIELEDEPVIANPYRDRMTSKSPGF